MQIIAAKVTATATNRTRTGAKVYNQGRVLGPWQLTMRVLVTPKVNS